MTEINDFIDALFAEARKQGLDEWQVKYVESESSDIQVFEQKVSKQGASAVRRLNLAVKAGDKIGHFVTECFDVAEAAFIVGEAAANAALMDCDEKFFFMTDMANIGQFIRTVLRMTGLLRLIRQRI